LVIFIIPLCGRVVEETCRQFDKPEPDPGLARPQLTVGGGEGVQWPDLEEDISVVTLLVGRKSGDSLVSLRRWRN
jgi:hypothetical protein